MLFCLRQQGSAVLDDRQQGSAVWDDRQLRTLAFSQVTGLGRRK